MKTDTDAQAIEAVLRGEVDRYAYLVDKYQAKAIRLAYGFLGNYEDAKDASQEAFVNAYRSLHRFKREASFSTWLYRIVVNVCKDAWRRKYRRPEAAFAMGSESDTDEKENLFIDGVDPSMSASQRLNAKEQGQAISHAINELSFLQKTAFLLHHVNDHSIEETSQIMGCRPGTAKSHLFRATANLRNALKSWVDRGVT